MDPGEPHDVWTDRRGDYEIATDKARLDVDAIHAFLLEAYWSPGVPRDVVERSIEHSLTFGVYAMRDGALVGFGRAVTDRAAFAYIGDVFVLPDHRGKGLGVWLVESMLAHPWLQGLRRIHLATADAHSLYARFGFRAGTDSANRMDLTRSPRDLWP